MSDEASQRAERDGRATRSQLEDPPCPARVACVACDLSAACDFSDDRERGRALAAWAFLFNFAARRLRRNSLFISALCLPTSLPPLTRSFRWRAELYRLVGPFERGFLGLKTLRAAD